VRIYKVIDDVSYLIIETPVVVVVIPAFDEPRESQKRLVATGGSYYGLYDYLYYGTNDDRFLYGLVSIGESVRNNGYDGEYDPSNGEFYDVGGFTPGNWASDADGTNLSAFPTTANMQTHYWYDNATGFKFQFDNPYYVIPSDSSVAVTELIFNGSDTINLVNIPEDATKVELFRNGIQLDDMVIDGTDAIVQIGTPAKYQAYIYNAVGEISYLLVETPILSIVTSTGGTVTEIDGFKVHTFTSSGNFVVEGGGVEIEYLVVGGGGGGATVYQSGGGGGGGMLSGTFANLPSGSYNIIVGTGGTAGSGGRSNVTIAGDGGFSQFHTFKSLGGAYGPSVGQQPGIAGGSGGGGSGKGNGIGTYGQGYDGGVYNYPAGGGGGGAGGQGGNAGGGRGGNGGVGRIWIGNGTKYAGGGGGGSWNGSGSSAYDGGGGGGNEEFGITGQSGTTNTGGGGGGGTPGGAGGSGIVIIRYAI
jgi:hypothetical protein